MSAYPLSLHVIGCLWYYFFWNNFLAAGRNEPSEDWHPKYRNVQEMGCRFLTNWNLVNES